MKTVYDIISDGYDRILDELLKLDDADDMHELKIVYESEDGTTITISWLDRDKRLADAECDT